MLIVFILGIEYFSVKGLKSNNYYLLYKNNFAYKFDIVDFSVICICFLIAQSIHWLFQ